MVPARSLLPLPPGVTRGCARADIRPFGPVRAAKSTYILYVDCEIKYLLEVRTMKDWGFLVFITGRSTVADPHASPI